MMFKTIVNLFEKLSSTTKRLEMTDILAEYFKEIKCEEIGFITLLCMGKVFPNNSHNDLGIANNMMIDALALSSGTEKKEVKKLWNAYGDIGETAKKLMSNKKQTSLIINELSLKELKETLHKLPSITGKGSVQLKLKMISKMLSMSSPTEALYLTRILIGSMRTGVGQGVIRDALSKAFDVPAEKIQRAYNLLTDYSQIAINLCKNPKLVTDAKIIIFNPINMMLFLKVKSVDEGFERVGRPARIEIKYDGLRAQIHKINNEVKIFTRNLDEVTTQFPDAVEYVKKSIKAQSIIFECEMVGFDPEKDIPLPFQFISKRIKRKYDILEISKQIPVKLFCFDLLMLNDKNYLDEGFLLRHNALKSVLTENENIMMAKGITTDDNSQALKLFNEGIEIQEGVMFKKLDANYQPGNRVGFGVKLKSHMKELDLVITEAYYGKGRRKDWFGSYTLSCYDNINNEFLTIGKLGTGFSDEQLKEMNELIKKNISKKETEKVILNPSIVVEVEYEEIQKSPTYSSGYALRFPRLVRFRPDKTAQEASSLDLIESLI